MAGLACGHPPRHLNSSLNGSVLAYLELTRRKAGRGLLCGSDQCRVGLVSSAGRRYGAARSGERWRRGRLLRRVVSYLTGAEVLGKLPIGPSCVR